MSDTLYTTAILRLATESAAFPPLTDPDLVAQARSPVCGSALTLSADMEGEAIVRVGLALTSCAVGQAAAALLAQAAPGRTLADLAEAEARVARWLEGSEGAGEPWPGFAAMATVRAFPARHGAVLLPFRAGAALRPATRDA